MYIQGWTAANTCSTAASSHAVTWTPNAPSPSTSSSPACSTWKARFPAQTLSAVQRCRMWLPTTRSASAKSPSSLRMASASCPSKPCRSIAIRLVLLVGSCVMHARSSWELFLDQNILACSQVIYIHHKPALDSYLIKSDISTLIQSHPYTPRLRQCRPNIGFDVSLSKRWISTRKKMLNPETPGSKHSCLHAR